MPLANHNILSKKETEVLVSLSKGSLYKEIAVEQKITINTVKKHCKNIYRKLAVRNRTEASNFFLSNSVLTKHNGHAITPKLSNNDGLAKTDGQKIANRANPENQN